MAYSRIMLPYWNSQGGISRMAFGMVFYIEDTPLPDPVRRGLPEFSGAALKKRLNWRPRSPKEEDSAEVKRLVSKVRLLAHSELSIIEVMAITIKQCI